MKGSGNQTNVLTELLALLELEKIEENIFRGRSQDLGFGNIFGGQVLGQSLSAAFQTVPQDRGVHSMHTYFMRPGDPKMPIVYQVDPIRDGKSFTTRRTVAIQKGRAIFLMSASFQAAEEGFAHQDDPPDPPGPQGLDSELDLARQVSDKIPEPLRAKLTCDRPIEIRQVAPTNPFAPRKSAPDNYVWFKTIDRLPDDPAVHKYMLAYASDFCLIGTSLKPHGKTFWDPRMQVATLDHAIWFHREFRVDEWLLYEMHSPSASASRGLNLGNIYTHDGRLAATVAQEGLIRHHGK